MTQTSQAFALASVGIVIVLCAMPASAAPNAPANPRAAPAPSPMPASPSVAAADRPSATPAAADAAERPLDLSLDVGPVVYSQAFHSNGRGQPGQLADYDLTSAGLAARVGARRMWAMGSVLRLGATGFYRYVGATGVNAPVYGADGARTNVRLGLESHQASVAFAAGLHFGALGGLDLEANVGPMLVLNYVDVDPRVPLPSDRMVALSTGARLAAPALAHVAARPLGVALEGSYVGLLSQYDQTENLQDGAAASSRAILAGAEISYGLLPNDSKTQLAVFLALRTSLQTASYAGVSARNGPTNGNVSESDRAQSMYFSAFGLRVSH